MNKVLHLYTDRTVQARRVLVLAPVDDPEAVF